MLANKLKGEKNLQSPCLDALQRDQKMVAGSTSIRWILEFNSKS